MNSLIEHCGIGYMANTSTKRCPSNRHKRTNVRISAIEIVKACADVPHRRVIALICGTQDIHPHDEIISLYENGDIHEEFNFYCTDPNHIKL